MAAALYWDERSVDNAGGFMTACIHGFVSGRVQGVFFRAAAADKARELGLDGWVRNLPDGRVEVLAAGDREALKSFTAWLHEGPPPARVDDVAVEECPASEAPNGFAIR